MEKLQFENEQFILYSPDSLKYITDNMQNILTKSFEYYKILFDVDTFRKFQINYFDDISPNGVVLNCYNICEIIDTIVQNSGISFIAKEE